MKKTVYLIVFAFGLLKCYGQNQGDFGFIGFNHDGDKDFSIVVFENIAANSIIYFTDGNPNVAGNGKESTSEGTLKWETGADMINAGTIVVFNDVAIAGSVSIGTLSEPDAGFLPSASGDAIYATYGDPNTNGVMTWISGYQNKGVTDDNFSATGLSSGLNFLIVDDTASKDGGKYNGVTSGKTITEFRALVADEARWMTSTTDGESFIPFDTIDFTLSVLNNDLLVQKMLRVYAEGGFLKSDQGKVVVIYNVLGQSILNEDLLPGVYFVKVLQGLNYKVIKIAL